MTAPDPRVGEIEARLSAASDWPWAIDADDFDGYAVFMDDGITWGRAYVCNGLNQGEYEGKTDAEFIANAPADVAFLLAELRKAHEALARVEALHVSKFYDKWSRKSDQNAGRGGWCNECGRFDGDACPTMLRAAVTAANGDGRD